MASFVIGEDTVRQEKERKEMENREKSRRHYKKDSRLVESSQGDCLLREKSIQDTCYDAQVP